MFIFHRRKIRGIFSWIILDGLVRWVASIMMQTNAQMGIILNVVAGIFGAFIGGFLSSNLLSVDINGFSIQSFLTALLGAVILIFLFKLISGRK